MIRTIILSLFTVFSANALAYTAGVVEKVYQDANRTRTLQLYIWYPSDSNSPSAILGGSPVFEGFKAVKDAPFVKSRFPLIVLSHGSGGNRSSLSWLATGLAKQGVIVIALNHPGSTTGNSIPSENIKAWERPRDVSFVINRVLTTPEFARIIDAGRIAVIGHSLGGYTALATVGASLKLDAFNRYCLKFPLHADCEFNRIGGVDPESVDKNLFEGNYLDKRITAAVAITPAYARSFDEQQLGQISRSVLIIGASDDQEIPGDLHAKYLFSQFHGQKVFTEIEGAGHYGFLPLCRPNALSILEVEGEKKICLDPVAKKRNRVHQETSRKILEFLKQLGFIPS